MRNSPGSHTMLGLAAAAAALVSRMEVRASEDLAAALYPKSIEPVLAEFCFDCHAEGARKGKVVFDEYPSHAAATGDRDLWLRVLKNVRAGLMPPAEESAADPRAKAGA